MPTKAMSREALNEIPIEKKTPQGTYKYKAKSGAWVVVEEGHTKAYNVVISEGGAPDTIVTDPKIRALEQQVAELRAMLTKRDEKRA